MESYLLKIFFCCYLLVSLFTPTQISLANGEELQKGWNKVKDKGGIKIFLKSVPGSKFKVFRGVVIIEASIDTIMSVFRDIPEHTKLLYRCSNSSLLKEINQFEYITYNVLDAPWPVKDRDSVNRISVTQDAGTKEVTISMKDLQKYFPDQDRIVRVTRFEGFWKLKPTRNGKVEVIFQMHVEPGGHIPSWASNLAVVVFPYNTLFALRQIVKLPKYQNTESLLQLDLH
ncbi:MAG: START domain-containing protein [Planctomycetota bacterium]